MEKCFQSFLVYYAIQQKSILQSLQGTVIPHLKQLFWYDCLRICLRTAVKSQNHFIRIVWVERDEKDHLALAPLPWGYSEHYYVSVCKAVGICSFPGWCRWQGWKQRSLVRTAVSFQKWHEGKEGARTKHLVLPSGRNVQSGLLQECKLDGCLENAGFSAGYRKPRDGPNLLIWVLCKQEWRAAAFNPKLHIQKGK